MTRGTTGRDPALELWVVLARATDALSRHARADIGRHGLADAEFGVLEILHHKGPLPVCQVQRRILLQSGSTTYVVDKLVRRGLVRRAPNPKDRRGILLTLTPAGRRLIARIFPGHARTLRSAMGGLSRAELKRAAALVRKLGLGAAERLGTQMP